MNLQNELICMMLLNSCFFKDKIDELCDLWPLDISKYGGPGADPGFRPRGVGEIKTLQIICLCQ